MQDSILDKIIRVLTPILVYLFANLFVQAGFTSFVMATRFKALGGDRVSYAKGFSFVENMEIIVKANTLTVTLIASVITIIVLLYMFRKDFRSIVFVKPKSGFLCTIAVGIFASAGISKLVTLFPIDGILGNYSETSSNVFLADVPMQILTLIIVGPIMEELLFRGMIYNRLKEMNESTIAAYLSAIIFGVYHLNLVQGIYTFILGFLLVYVYETYKSLAAPILLHMAANAVAVVMNYLPISKVINGHWYFKLPVMLVEIGILVVVTYFFVYNKNKKDNVMQQ